jgi:hypothetical protein
VIGYGMQEREGYGMENGISQMKNVGVRMMKEDGPCGSTIFLIGSRTIRIGMALRNTIVFSFNVRISGIHDRKLK